MSEQFYPLRVAAVRPETDTATCVTFEVPDRLRETFAYQHGQYLTLRREIDGVEVRRSYSICSGVGDEQLNVAVKRVAGGVFSNFVNDELRTDDTLEVLPPAGTFTTPLDPDHEKQYLCIAAGSGITPIISIVKSILSVEPSSDVTLLFGNQKVSTIMFREELENLKNAHMARFQLIHVLSRENREFDVLNGRINNKKGAELCQHLLDLQAIDEFFLCGPEAMISEVSRGLRANGIDEDRIHYELFGASAADAAVAIEKHQQRAKRLAGQTFEVKVIADGRETVLDLGADGENILDAALDAGLDLPFACKGGVCATCKAKLISGTVEMDINHALGGDEVEQGTILSCQAHPTSDGVIVNFDQAV